MTDIQGPNVAPSLTPDERAAFAALVAERGWSERDLRSLMLKQIDETGSRCANTLARSLLASHAPSAVAP